MALGGCLRQSSARHRRARQERVLGALTAVIFALGVAQVAAPLVSQGSDLVQAVGLTATATATVPGPSGSSVGFSFAISASPPGSVAPPAAKAPRAVPPPARLPAGSARPASHAATGPTTTTAPAAAGSAAAVVAPSAGASPPMHPTAPGGYGCDAALAYLAANQAPGFVDVCAPQAAGPGDAGKTSASTDHGVTTGTIYISCPAPIVYQNESSNSWKFSGLSNAPIDPWGGVPISQCRPGDIAPG
jgi:hypothetical protein